jgi:putative hydrolase of HD superfamily
MQMIMNKKKLRKQIEFIEEIDKLKSIIRRTRLLDDSRYENDAEHSWHLAMMAIVLSEHANDKNIDLLKVIKMLLIHDIPEIDAGDTFLYDKDGRIDSVENEKKGAERIFSILPSGMTEELIGLWEEFEKKKTPEAKFAGALDRLEPLLQNYNTGGHAWKKHGIVRSQVEKNNLTIVHGSQTLWDLAQSLIDESVEKEYLEDS